MDTDTRNSVVKIVSDDGNNKLVNYAVKNSSSVAAMVAGTKSEAEKLEIWGKARQGAVYRLDDAISREFQKSSRTRDYLHWAIVCDRCGCDCSKRGRI